MASNTNLNHIYLVSVVIAIIFIAIFVLVLIITKPKSEKTEDNPEIERPKKEPDDYQNNDRPLAIPFSEGCVKYHNTYRSKHKQTNSVSLSKTLTTSSKKKADEMARTGDFSHTPDLEYGENLYYFAISRGSAEIFAKLDCDKPSKAWYNEIKDYNYRAPEQSSGVVGHFTQMVWKNTKQIGCSKSYSKQSTSIYVVCHYNPPGNYIGSYPLNVLPPKY